MPKKKPTLKTLDESPKWSMSLPENPKEIKRWMDILGRGRELEKDEDGRPTRICALPQKIRDWWDKKKD